MGMSTRRLATLGRPGPRWIGPDCHLRLCLATAKARLPSPEPRQRISRSSFFGKAYSFCRTLRGKNRSSRLLGQLVSTVAFQEAPLAQSPCKSISSLAMRSSLALLQTRTHSLSSKFIIDQGVTFPRTAIPPVRDRGSPDRPLLRHVDDSPEGLYH